MRHAYDQSSVPSEALLGLTPHQIDCAADRYGYAAEICALRDWLVPEEPQPQQSAMAFSDWNLKIEVWDDRQRLRALLTAEADRAEKGE
jgi:hypothetical protein